MYFVYEHGTKNEIDMKGGKGVLITFKDKKK